MKYAMFIADGMSDYPLEEFNDRTPLQVARTPNMDRIAREGISGTIKVVPHISGASSDIAIMSLLGYDPRKFHSGRGPLEAASIGIKLKEDEIAFRCNLVTTGEGVLIDYSAGHISTKEAGVLIDLLNRRLGSDDFKFYPGVHYRHILVIHTGEGSRFSSLQPDLLRCTPPHDISGRQMKRYLPRGEGSGALRELMDASREILEGHEINQLRQDLGENVANMIWLWGQGRTASFPPFGERFKVTGGVISAVNVVNGIAVCIGLKVIRVPGATGYFDTDYEAKARYAISCLRDDDFVLVHLEATDEAGHMGDARAKVRAIEDFDKKTIGPVFAYIRELGGYRITVLPDHFTPVSVRTHTDEPVPFALCGDGISPDRTSVFSEVSAAGGSVHMKGGYKLMDYFLT